MSIKKFEIDRSLTSFEAVENKLSNTCESQWYKNKVIDRLRAVYEHTPKKILDRLPNIIYWNLIYLNQSTPMTINSIEDQECFISAGYHLFMYPYDYFVIDNVIYRHLSSCMLYIHSKSDKAFFVERGKLYAINADGTPAFEKKIIDQDIKIESFEESGNYIIIKWNYRFGRSNVCELSIR